MQIRKTISILAFLLIAGSLHATEHELLVSGYVFEDSTLQPVTNHVVTLKLKNQDPPFLMFQKVYTDSAGFYSKWISMPFSSGILKVSTVDCNNELITQNLPFNSLHNQLTANFYICYNAQLNYCRADFIYLAGNDDLNMVIFKNASLGNVNTWLWDFGDGQTSALADPVHYYEEDGLYQVCLTASDSNGTCNDTYCEFIEVQRDTICQSYFTYYPYPGVENTIQFWDLSIGEIGTWEWDFGDGNTSQEQNPAHTFAASGTYEVCLSVTDVYGFCTHTFCTDVLVVESSECTANFAYFNDPVEPLKVNFIDNSNGNPDNWFWDFGDGQTSNLSNPMHEFEEEGVYDVCLTIINGETGCQDTYCEIVMVYHEPPCAAFFEHVEMSTDPYTYQYVDQSIGNIISWQWDFGDGSTSTHQNPIHSYYENGEYDVCLSVTNEAGTCTDVYCETFYVGITPDCMANFYFSQDTINPLNFHFTDASTGNIEFWEWDFGDGTTSELQNPSHTFNAPGIYFVCLTIGNSTGDCSETLCKEVVVTGNISCQAEYNYFILPENPLAAQFIDLSIGDVDVWIWDFGDGTTSMETNPMHLFQEEGNYDVCLHILDINSGCIDQVCKNIKISHNPACMADFAFMPSVNDPLTYQFVDQSSGSIVEWNWDFGDGTASGFQNPVHSFPDEGTYEVCLQISNLPGNCLDEVCKNITIELEQMCNADFDYTIAPDQPFTVEFTDLSSGIMTEWFWEFGDGNTSTGQNPVHTYADTGTYTVELTVQHPDSLAYCESSTGREIQINVPAPECSAGFSAIPDSGINKPYLYHFTDLSTGNPDTRTWDFGDGNTSGEQNPSHQYSESGTYNVSLIITKYNPYGENCTDTHIIEIITPEYYHLGGFVYAGEYPINNPEHQGDTAEVFIYRYNGDLIEAVDTSQFTELGYYYALYLLEADYLIKARLTEGSVNAGSYFPTYFGDRLTWQEAGLKPLTDSSHYHSDIHLTALPEAETGNGNIGGIVMKQQDRNSMLTIPAEDTEVLLFNNNLDPLKYDFTSPSGDFHFNALPYGIYYLLAESAGMYGETHQVILSESNPGISNVELEIFSEDILGIGQNENLIPEIHVYPNPVSSYLFVELSSERNTTLTARITDPTGRDMQISRHKIQAGKNRISLDVSGLANGLYVLRCTVSDGQIFHPEKFMK